MGDNFHHTLSLVINLSFARAYSARAIVINTGEYLDILAISCDSFNEDTNFAIGRCQGGKNHLNSLKSVRSWCSQYRVAFKMNTVVNTHNLEEDMTEEILDLTPIRWKVRYSVNSPA